MKKPIQEKSIECILLIFEVGEVFDESIDTLNAFIQHKNLKVSTRKQLILIFYFNILDYDIWSSGSGRPGRAFRYQKGKDLKLRREHA